MANWTFDFTPEKLAQCCSRNKQPAVLFAALEAVLPKYEINNVDRVAAFLAQCGHESVDFSVLQENLNYSAKGLCATWPSRFRSEAEAMPYNRNPEAIANRVYSSRMGNGDEASGDGWRYRGRGAIQLTGKSNYQAFGDSIGFGHDLDAVVAYIETLQGAVESAAFFWTKNNLNPLADDRNITALTKKINGGTLGLEERKEHMIHNLEVLEA